jgi:hypothetical protein
LIRRRLFCFPDELVHALFQYGVVSTEGFIYLSAEEPTRKPMRRVRRLAVAALGRVTRFACTG